MKGMMFLMAGVIILAGGCRKKDKEKATAAGQVAEILVNTPITKGITYTYEYPAYLEAIQTVNLVARSEERRVGKEC